VLTQLQQKHLCAIELVIQLIALLLQLLKFVQLVLVHMLSVLMESVIIQ